MAILIPTKNIYHLDAPASFDNRVTGISYEPIKNVVSEQEEAVATETAVKTSFQREDSGNYDLSWKTSQVTQNSPNVDTLAVYSAFKNHSFCEVDIKIPVLGENKAIKSVKTGFDSDGNTEIKISASYSTKKGKVNADGSFSTSDVTKSIVFDNMFYSYVEDGDDVDSLPESITYEKSTGSLGLQATATVNLSRSGETVGTVRAETKTIDGEDFYVIKGLAFLSKVFAVKMYFDSDEEGIVNMGNYSNVPFKGEYEKYTLKRATITINGVSAEISQPSTEPVYVGAQGKKSISMQSGNDFIQAGAVELSDIDSTINIQVDIPDLSSADIHYGRYFVEETGASGEVDVRVDPQEEFALIECVFENYFKNSGLVGIEADFSYSCDISYSDGTWSREISRVSYNESDDTLFIGFPTKRGDIAKFIVRGSLSIKDVFSRCYEESLEKYKVGKECIDLKVSVSDYFNEDGTLAISADGNGRMCFDIGDEVIVMARQNGEDAPISVGANGANKFSVIKRKLIYDGSVLQGLSLQRI